MENKILVVPDVHGRPFWRKVLDSELPVVFLGDYLDPYSYEGITKEQALKEFKDIVKFALMEPDRVTLLLGNHMAHYVGLSADICRFDHNNCKEIYKIVNDNKLLFQHCLKWGNAIFTHAGITKGWLEHNNIPENFDTIDKDINRDIIFSDEYLPRPDYIGCLNLPITQISWYRGGSDSNGSPMWADIEEMIKNPAFTDKIQIFGHTQLQKTGNFIHSKASNWYCCDSRDVFIWDGTNLTLFKNDE